MMKRRYRAAKRPAITISPINRNSSDDGLVVGKISVNSDFGEKSALKPKCTSTHIQKKNLFDKIKIEDIIIFGIIIMLLYKRNDPESDDCDESEEKNTGFSLEGLKKMLPLDKLTENDILLILMLYLLF